MALSLEDSELLSFYSSQSLAHLSCLADAIDVLYSSVQGNQPPRIFVARGKSLIVTAHKLVFIGDTLSRLLTSPDLRAKVRRGRKKILIRRIDRGCECVRFDLRSQPRAGDCVRP